MRIYWAMKWLLGKASRQHLPWLLQLRLGIKSHMQQQCRQGQKYKLGIAATKGTRYQACPICMTSWS